MAKQKNYAIMRISKLKGNNDFAKVINHNFREYENSIGVDKEKNHLNTYRGLTDYKAIRDYLKSVNSQIEYRTGKKVRKDRVRGYEVLFAVNKEYLEDELKAEAYFKAAESWMIEEFGEKNFVNFAIHRDEDGAIHGHGMVTCLTKDKDGQYTYNSENWIAGKQSRQSLIDIQDRWFAHVSKTLKDLDRGLSAKFTHNYHKTKQEYVKLLQKEVNSVNELNDHELHLLATKALKEAQKDKEIEKAKDKEIEQMIYGNEKHENISKTKEKVFEDELEL